jgi:hypothetical protein
MGLNLFQFLKSICNFKLLSSTGNIQSDLDYYYNQTYQDTNQMLVDFSSVYNEFWKEVNIPKISSSNALNIKLVNPEQGCYKHIMKIDFKRAFTNYVVQLMNADELSLYNYYCNKVSRMYMFESSKKYLYNYFLTNIIDNNKLKELRYNVYEDVLYLASHYGDIIKSEVDGCYVQTNREDCAYYDVYGEYNTKLYDNIYFVDKLQIMQRKDKVQIKGITKNTPNIVYKLFRDIVKEKDDRVIYNYFTDKSIHISDWFHKSDDGNSIKIMLKNMTVNAKTETYEDIKKIQKYSEYINRDKYFDSVKNTLIRLMNQIILNK